MDRDHAHADHADHVDHTHADPTLVPRRHLALLLLSLSSLLHELHALSIAALHLTLSLTLICLHKTTTFFANKTLTANIETATFTFHDNELNQHLANHLPRYFLSGIPQYLPPNLSPTTFLPWLWRVTIAKNKGTGDKIVVNYNGVVVDLVRGATPEREQAELCVRSRPRFVSTCVWLCEHVCVAL